MSLSSSMWAGLSGMNAYGNGMAVLGDNLANTNTTGFKSSSVVFSDIIATTNGTGSGLQVGRGNRIAAIDIGTAQGSFMNTQSSTDVAIEGNGYFVVADTQTPQTRYYTRAGNFTQDSSGFLVTPSGLRVQGYQYNTTTGTTAATLSDINLSGALSQPKATTTAQIGMNLNASASAASTFQSSFTAYNALGEAINVTINLNPSTVQAGQWDYSFTSSLGTPLTTTSSGSLFFNSTGTLIGATSPVNTTVGATGATTDPTFTIQNFASGAADLSFTWDLFTAAGASNGSTSQFAAPSATTSIVQDGYTIGNIVSVAVDNDGNVNGTFSNGQVQTIYQLGMADFISPWNLSRVGGTLFQETFASGQPTIGKPNVGGMGSIFGSTLEQSTTDMATEFTQMIQFQRSFQSSSKIISATDQLLQETIALVR